MSQAKIKQLAQAVTKLIALLEKRKKETSRKIKFAECVTNFKHIVWIPTPKSMCDVQMLVDDGRLEPSEAKYYLSGPFN